MWIVIDGMDGSGKSTVADRTAKNLREAGREVVIMQHPNPESLPGRVSRKFLQTDRPGASMFATLFYVADIFCSIRKLRKATDEDVIFVRYLLSVAYLPEGPARFAYRFFSKLLGVADLSIYVDVSADTAMSRIEARGDTIEIFETQEKLESTREKMLILTDGWKIVDNNGTPEDTFSELERVISGALFR